MGYKKFGAVATALANNVAYINFEGTTDSEGLLDLDNVGNYIPILAKNFPYVSTFFNGASANYHPYARITYYDETPYANQSVSMRAYVVPTNR